VNRQLKTMLFKAEGRYFDESEAAFLMGYAEATLARLDTAQAIERAEPAILDDVVAAVMSTHPDIQRIHGDGGAPRVRRDQAMTLRYATLAMIQQDPDFIHDKFAVWIRTILGALCALEHVTCGYRALIDACRRHLLPDDAAAVIPYIQIVLDQFEQPGARSS
jgi:hypothetical protein